MTTNHSNQDQEQDIQAEVESLLDIYAFETGPMTRGAKELKCKIVRLINEKAIARIDEQDADIVRLGAENTHHCKRYVALFDTIDQAREIVGTMGTILSIKSGPAPWRDAYSEAARQLRAILAKEKDHDET